MSGIEIHRIHVDKIVAEDRLRRVDPLKVAGFVNDIGQRGLKTPLTVSQLLAKGTHRLICGGHRFEAVRQLGWTEVDVVIHMGTLDEQDMDEALENLTRSELTQLDCALHVAKVRYVWKKQHPNRTHGGVRQKGEEQDSPKESWTDAIVEQTGWSGGTLARLAKIGTEIDKEAADLLFGTPISNIQKELQALIEYSPELQRAIAAKISDGSAKTVAQGAAQVTNLEPVEPAPLPVVKQVSRMWSSWEKISDEAKREFVLKLKGEGFI